MSRMFHQAAEVRHWASGTFINAGREGRQAADDGESRVKHGASGWCRWSMCKKVGR